MTKKNLLKEITEQITEALPSHLGSLKKDFEKNCRHILTSAFAKFDLVTREEFDVQTKVLGRTRKKLDQLETQIQELESLLKNKREK